MKLINFSTTAVSLALKGEAVYAGSKAGLKHFRELCKRNG